MILHWRVVGLVVFWHKFDVVGGFRLVDGAGLMDYGVYAGVGVGGCGGGLC